MNATHREFHPDGRGMLLHVPDMRPLLLSVAVREARVAAARDWVLLGFGCSGPHAPLVELPLERN